MEFFSKKVIIIFLNTQISNSKKIFINENLFSTSFYSYRIIIHLEINTFNPLFDKQSGNFNLSKTFFHKFSFHQTSPINLKSSS